MTATAGRIAKGQRTRDSVVRKAIELFAKHGYDQTSFQMIADACGVSQAAPLYHFKNRFGLFRAAVEQIMVNLVELQQDVIVEVGRPRQRMKSYCLNYANWVVIKPAEGQVLFLLYYFAAFDNNFAALFRRMQLQMRTEIKSIVASEKNLDLEVVARAIQDFLAGMGVHILAGRMDTVSPSELEMRIAKMIDAILPERGPP